MGTHTMITISREYGSGGHEIGKALAERLELPFYDNELISIAARESGYSPETINNAEKSATSRIAYAFSMVGTGGAYRMSINDQLYMIQSGIIRTICDKESAIIVGRCADYVLKEYAKTVDIFICSSEASRIERIRERRHVTAAEAKDIIRKMDKYRSTYYNIYTNQKWGDRKHYDIVINTAGLSTEDSVDLLVQFIHKKTGEAL